MNLNEFTDQELRDLSSSVKSELSSRKSNRLEENRILKQQREAEFKGKINADDTVNFLFNKKEYSGVVESANKSTCTIIFNKDNEELKRRINYCNIVEILETAEIEEQDQEAI